MATQSEYEISVLYKEAQSRWLKPPEVFFILQNHERYQITDKLLQKPTSGTLFLFNKRVLKFFRKDGHQWRRKKDGKAIAEAHERLKVGAVEALNCYYAHGELDPTLQRRIYWMLDPDYEHIVLVHYRNVTEGKEGKQSSGHVSQFTRIPSTISSIGTQYSNYNHFIGEPTGIHHYASTSLGTTEVNSEIPEDSTSSSELKFRQALKTLEEELNIGDDTVNIVDPNYIQKESLDSLQFLEDIDHFAQPLQRPESNKIERRNGGYDGAQYPSNNLMLVNNDSATLLLPQELGSFEVPGSYSTMGAPENNAEYCIMMDDEGNIGLPFEQEMSFTTAHKQKFSIQDISPEWGYANETTKVIIVGSFLCDPTISTWSCMFGSVEVPLEIIKEGVIRFEAPPFGPGKFSFSIASGDGLSCSEIKEFEYRDKPNTSCPTCNTRQQSPYMLTDPDQLLLLVRFVQTLLSSPVSEKESNLEPSFDKLLKKLKADDEQWSRLIETIRDGNAEEATTMDWILQELLKDKLDVWLSSRSRSRDEDQTSCSLSKQEQGIIHMVAGLGYEWALYPILGHGVRVDFRDIKGWSALHWAARFGREKMVAALIASGASAGAVTDPSSQDTDGKTAASIAASNGHKGLAGYLSEIALTNHLASLTLKETDIPKDSAQVQEDIALNSILEASQDQISMKDSLAAVRNAAQAAARIQAAFRAYSFRKQKQREAAMAACLQEYGIYCKDIEGVSALSKLTFGKIRNYHSSAVSIQKKYRGWKDRKAFLALRQNVVKIQAHLRGYQMRKHYKVIIWAVGVFDKVVRRWRRKSVGLQVLRKDIGTTEEDSDDEDILKVFRKQKVDGAVDKAFSRVLSMANSPEARQQYTRVLKRYFQKKAELGKTETLGSGGNEDDDDGLFDIADMEFDNLFSLL